MMRLFTIYISTVIFVIGCSGGSDDPPPPNVTETTVILEINESLILLLGNSDTLLGDISIDGGTPVDLSIDVDSSTASVTFTNLDSSTYTFLITYH